MIVSIIINTALVMLGYYLGLKKAKKDWEFYLNDSEEIRDAFTYYLSSQALEQEGLEPEDVPATEDSEKQTEEGERVYKSFNISSNIKDLSGKSQDQDF